MSKSVNKVILVGNLTRDPEMRYTGTQTAIAKLGIATNESRKDQESGVNGEIFPSIIMLLISEN